MKTRREADEERPWKRREEMNKDKDEKSEDKDRDEDKDNDKKE